MALSIWFKLAVSALSFSVAIESVCAAPAADTPKNQHISKRGTFSIIGATNGCVNRQRIDIMQSQQPDTFNLFLLALAEVQSYNASNPWSYYQLSGIHGAPFVPWPDPSETGNFDRSTGYCPHSSVLFGTWHRPYMLALEQIVVQVGINIANAFTGTNKAKYVTAAAQLRFPYWDWASADAQSHLPSIIKQSTVSVFSPTGQKTINNPLYSYSFKSTENKATGFGSPYNQLSRTVRAASRSLTDNEAAADSNMQSGFQGRRTQVYNTLMMTGNYNDFSSAVEGIHNNVHVAVGGNYGHMSYLTYSAFDPIFWLHHNNIDRLFAIWQAANPGLGIRSASGVDTFARPNPSTDDVNTQLYPFTNAAGNWWTSVDVSSAASIWRYNYGFPEVPCSYQTSSASQLDSFATSQINTLYKAKVASRKHKRYEEQTVLEWDINVVVDQSELQDTFSIYFFLGPIPQDPDQWVDQKIGLLTVLNGQGMTMPSKLVTATIPLNPALRDRINDSEDNIDNYLEQNLVWGCLNGGNVVDITKLSTLKVGVTNNPVTFPADTKQKTKFGNPRFRSKVTRRKRGGVSNAEQLKKPKTRNGRNGGVPGRFSKIQNDSN
ncbi:hypothetical protein H072_4515 [Dactylellina haptotyla CBS 200.50]|uniref:tyrosinase n=1 Tax=Dactylellina haptotyla (strain CBS 200.50) TaxID=1284197 RepID=S8AEV1_DACHA|nr:hypothetical protein H072_4515 [Dactylellina haptotyla CBS 200.50]